MLGVPYERTWCHQYWGIYNRSPEMKTLTKDLNLGPNCCHKYNIRVSPYIFFTHCDIIKDYIKLFLHNIAIIISHNTILIHIIILDCIILY